MNDRKSFVTWSDCTYLNKKFNESTQYMMKYLASGCPKQGVADDTHIVCSLIDIRNLINKLLEQNPNNTLA